MLFFLYPPFNMSKIYYDISARSASQVDFKEGIVRHGPGAPPCPGSELMFCDWATHGRLPLVGLVSQPNGDPARRDGGCGADQRSVPAPPFQRRGVWRVGAVHIPSSGLNNSLPYLFGPPVALTVLHLDRVVPGDHGSADVWYFPFTRRFWAQLLARRHAKRKHGYSMRWMHSTARYPPDSVCVCGQLRGRAWG